MSNLRSLTVGKGRAAQDAAQAVLREIGEDKTVSFAKLGSGARVRAAPKKSSAPLRRRTQEERRSESEERLLAAAIDLLSRKGWVGMTLAEIGEAAGYSRGQATHQFGNKAGLLRALVLRLHQSFTEKIQEAPPSTPGLQAVLGYVRVYFGRTDAEWVNTRANLLLLAETLLEESETLDIVHESSRPIVAWLEENLRIGIAKGEVRPDVDIKLGVEFVVGVLRGLAQQRLAQGRITNLRKNKEQVVSMVEQAFAARSSRDGGRSSR
ncbi:TetR/AcrR family transcriptional regulator [Bradyrhizobium sp. 190]|uniref:TetR/AcrR family transcriptional regulator n=1 Tax=Bradyrhizobium sp. 190 TaxID=2782658 RepID=UPI001FF8465A|nr:TetR/AcrR family transcriptional regulator [Bradyrhizobium sp. 190]MCK1513220.1 TetR/AcrR family transcriptional regulator [Bradyrhizobium sp. 190]